MTVEVERELQGEDGREEVVDRLLSRADARRHVGKAQGCFARVLTHIKCMPWIETSTGRAS